MKKLICLLLTLSLLGSFALAEVTRVAALKGPTAMGMVKMADDDAGENYSFEIMASADEITPRLVQGELDIAALPANLASVLYARTGGELQVLAINTLGVLYIAQRGDTIHSVSDLAGRTIYTAGKGSTPEFALDYILTANGLIPGRDVFIEFKAEHSECLAALLSDENATAMLPQPFLTTAMREAEDVQVALDLTAEWDELQGEGGSTMITGVVVARRTFIEEYPEAVQRFLADYEASVDFTNANVAEAARLIGEYDIVPEAVAAAAIPACNICFISGQTMKEKLSGYLEILCDAAPESVGGTLPDDTFYYGADD